MGKEPRTTPAPFVGQVQFGDLRRVEPISRSYGLDRGRPIDRYYIERFLSSEAASITGRVLEIADNSYTQLFGETVTKSDVLNLHDGIEGTTFVDDLTIGSTLPSGAFDCVILTQTLNLIFDINAALTTVHRILKPRGVLLCTVPGITQISYEGWNDTWYWGLTINSAARLAGQVFTRSAVSTNSYGNVLSAIGFLQGLADCELTPEELDVIDQEYQVIVALKATKVD